MTQTAVNANYQGVIFDLDNTLVSSSLNFKHIRAEIGCTEHTDLLTYIEQLPEVEAQAAMDIVLSHEYQDAESAVLMPGVVECLAALAEQNIKMAVVTRNCQHAAQLKLAKTGLRFDIVLTRDDAPAKPDPTALLQVTDSWQVNPSQCIYVGDFLFDIQAADNAQMDSCLYIIDARPDYADTATHTIEHFSQLTKLVLP
ncbi:phosphatase [Pseudoalteromonas phenolica]|uniref:phosphoglycolate phosphatase n=1 Tax=Pseudoalteromonas phenolica TaxID=161398 RepID=A0A5R9Q674_9GAMM|nr:HAD family hydrolase [Pseudoalteromonas phenolica]TLX48152.1 phosphatase [Pseudoalteromonas phenolica]